MKQENQILRSLGGVRGRIHKGPQGDLIGAQPGAVIAVWAAIAVPSPSNNSMPDKGTSMRSVWYYDSWLRAA